MKAIRVKDKMMRSKHYCKLVVSNDLHPGVSLKFPFSALFTTSGISIVIMHWVMKSQTKLSMQTEHEQGLDYVLLSLTSRFSVCNNEGSARVKLWFQFSQFSRSVVSDSLRPCESQHARPPCPSPMPRVHSDSTSIKSVMPSSHLILCRPFLLLPPIPPSIRVFSNGSTLHMRWPKYWSFSFSIIPSKEIPGLISFRMDWLDLLAVQGTLKNLLP